MNPAYDELGIIGNTMNYMANELDTLESLGVFTRLLARSGTGQPITSYTSHYRRPAEGQAFHIIIVDNGRSEILAKQDHVRTLNCIRCGQCMNTCPVYRRSAGLCPLVDLYP